MADEDAARYTRLWEQRLLPAAGFREALRALSEAAFGDINHYLRPGHLAQLRKILDDPEASDNDKFVAFDFLKNANIAAGGILPMCQDTGTAIIMGMHYLASMMYIYSISMIALKVTLNPDINSVGME